MKRIISFLCLAAGWLLFMCEPDPELTIGAWTRLFIYSKLSAVVLCIVGALLYEDKKGEAYDERRTE